MYEVGQTVVYGIHGVCRILNVEEKTVDRKKLPYFVLEPLQQPGTRYYIPSQNPAALSKLRPLMDADRLRVMLVSAQRSEAWIADENKRKQYYREIINGVDCLALMRMVYAIERHKQAQRAAGRKLHMCDENFLQDAIRILSMELSLVLEIPVADVPAYLWQQAE